MVRIVLFLCMLSFCSTIFGDRDHLLYVSAYDGAVMPNKVLRPPKPLMWVALLKVDRAANVGYEHKFYSYGHWIDLSGGLSVSYLQTLNEAPDEAFVGSCYLMSRWHLVRNSSGSFFVLWSPAGPSMISKNRFSRTAWSTRFVFQNQFGFGFSLKKDADIEVFIKQYHYSNGDIFPVNGGVDLPFALGISIKL